MNHIRIIFVGLIALFLPAFSIAGDPLEDFTRIVVLKEAGNDEAVTSAAEKFLSDHPDAEANEAVLFILGRIYEKRKQFGDAIRVFTRFLEEHSNSPLVTEAAMQRGEAYRQSEMNREMIPDFQRAYEGYKEAKHANAAHAQYHIVQGYKALGRNEEAMATAKLLVKDYPASNYAKNAAKLMNIKIEAPAKPAERGLPVGTKAPEIEMTLLSDGAKKTLSSFQGKVVVVDFWASWCGPCQKPMEKMQTYREAHPEWDGKVELIALSIDNTIEAASEHLAKRGWNKTLNAWGGEGGFRSKSASAFNVRGIPAVFVINQEGEVAATGHPASLDISGIVGGLLK